MPEDLRTPTYGVGDASFRAAGGEDGIRRLVDDFYDAMERLPAAAAIRAMHPADLTSARDKLARFLCGWMNGPKRYQEKYGPISIPGAHAHLAIDTAARDAWLACMAAALERQAYAEDFKRYLLQQLSIPAERVRNRE
ncbi:MAG TPA: group II truncated hemoglobin [Gammaproteobacteria bacterium]|nr:group II truncated hemoglobin [Gammaproteobacteria bacterium]